jgi:hypothetical protein
MPREQAWGCCAPGEVSLDGQRGGLEGYETEEAQLIEKMIFYLLDDQFLSYVR